ncbi:hypothetical protein N7470_005707 [Penicillium chermesinum]|nr:hypothetical protein N7470_005707 [Penicillium chermesinum]
MSDQKYYTLAEGCPYASSQTSVLMRNKSGGGLGLLQDTQLIETLAHFSRERIPERVVHAKAVGAYGEFEATRDCSDFTSASFLNQSGSADTSRDVHGFALKFYTDEGNLDWVFNNTPVFFIRDPVKFPSLNRSHKRNPRSHLPDANMFWDFHVGNPEGIHQLLVLFSDRGTPRSVRYLNGYSGHTYRFTKPDGSFKYAKIHIKTQQGVENLSREEATRIAGENPDYMIQDMYEAIERKEYPVWNVYVQLMSPEEAENYRWNIFDMTKVWSHKDFPLIQIGRLTMNRNPNNYFADIEQAAFSPSTVVPGFAASADPILQARLFAYPDAARYRLGVNYQQLPTNAAKSQVYCPFQRDGAMRMDGNYGGDPNYALNLSGAHEKWVGEVSIFTSQITDDDFVQPAQLWEVIGREPGHQERVIENLVGSLIGVKYPELRKGVYALFSRVNKDLGSALQKRVEEEIKAKQS